MEHAAAVQNEGVAAALGKAQVPGLVGECFIEGVEGVCLCWCQWLAGCLVAALDLVPGALHREPVPPPGEDGAGAGDAGLRAVLVELRQYQPGSVGRGACTA